MTSDHYLHQLHLKSKPSLSEMFAYCFEANNRYIDMRKRNPKSASSAVMAAKIESNVARDHESSKNGPVVVSPSCPLCHADKNPNGHYHKLSECEVYKEPQKKVKRLKDLCGCLTCGRLGHLAVDCIVKLKPCFKCGDKHMSYLCSKVGPPHSSKSNTRSEQIPSTSNNLVTFGVNSDQFNDVVLPTLTVNYKSKRNGKGRLARLFCDLGSQTSFVKGNPETIPKCEFVREVKINITGINSDKEVSSSLVTFPVFINGVGERTIQAVCIDKISSEFTAPNLKDLSDKLKTKGYPLADTQIISDSVSDVQILLGSDQSHIIPFKQITFGNNSSANSCLFETPGGVMLSGSVSKYLSNLESLPDKVTKAK